MRASSTYRKYFKRTAITAKCIDDFLLTSNFDSFKDKVTQSVISLISSN